MKKILLIIFLLFAVGYSCSAQTKPIDLARKILTESTDNSEFYAEDFETKFDFKELRTLYNLTFKSTPIKDNVEVVSVTAKGKENNDLNFYLYFHRYESRWKLFDWQHYEGSTEKHYLKMLNNLDKKQIDSIIKSNDDRKIFTSKEQFNYMKSVYDLALNSDEQIVNYLRQNKKDFEKLKKQFDNFVTNNPEYNNSEKNTFFSENYYSGLSISNITEHFQGLDNCLTFIISENGYEAVGYFYTSDKIKIPIINPKKIFFIQEIEEGWYMFRST